MNEQEFRQQMIGDFTPDERETSLHEKLADYYRITENMNNHYARNHWDLFNRWCSDRGYTREEINRAKRNVRV